MTDLRSDLAHLYRRAGFGARPDELDAAVGRGYEATVESLLAGLTGPDGAGDRLALPALTMPGAIPPVRPAPAAGGAAGGAAAGAAGGAAAGAAGAAGGSGGATAGSSGAPATTTTLAPAAAQAAAAQRRQDENREETALQAWWLNRMIVTSTPLREKLTLLWSGHFATGFEKVRNAALMHLQNDLFRTLGGGSFLALTTAVAKDPAMQVWLDTATDVAAHPNENFARELMELFTLGIGNYTEIDVKEAARCFTGWSYNRATGAFVVRPRLHDSGPKTVLGQTGNFDGDDVVRIVTNLPASHRFVVAKLWSHLAYPVSPSDPIVAQLTPAYSRDLNITNLLRAIFLHPDFTGPTARNGLVKQPIEYVVGAARAFGLTATPPPGARRGSPSLPAVLRLLAQEPFNPPNVGGWPQNEYWLSTVSSAVRLQFGTQVGASAALDAISQAAIADRPAALAHLLSVDGWGQTTLAALGHAAADPPALVALALSAPEYVVN